MSREFDPCDAEPFEVEAKPNGVPTKPHGKKIRILHGVNSTRASHSYEGFTATDYDFVHDFISDRIKKFKGLSAGHLDKAEIEKVVLSAMKEISKDEMAIFWNKWSERVSFTIHAKATTYNPMFAPGCTITVS